MRHSGRRVLQTDPERPSNPNLGPLFSVFLTISTSKRKTNVLSGCGTGRFYVFNRGPGRGAKEGRDHRRAVRSLRVIPLCSVRPPPPSSFRTVVSDTLEPVKRPTSEATGSVRYRDPRGRLDRTPEPNSSPKLGYTCLPRVPLVLYRDQSGSRVGPGRPHLASPPTHLSDQTVETDPRPPTPQTTLLSVPM